MRFLLRHAVALLVVSAKFDRYDERFGNIDVLYDGNDEHLLAAVKTAVSDLR